METTKQRKFTQLTLHIEGIELDIMKRKILEAAMGSEIRKLISDMDNVKKYGFIKDPLDIKDFLPDFPFPYGIVIDMDGILLSKYNKQHGLI